MKIIQVTLFVAVFIPAILCSPLLEEFLDDEVMEERGAVQQTYVKFVRRRNVVMFSYDLVHRATGSHMICRKARLYLVTLLTDVTR